MAGPWTLKPGDSQGRIPTYLFSATTVNVEVIGGGNGKVRLQAGGSPPEETDVYGQQSFRRSFGGVYLTVTNTGFRTIKVFTA